MNINLSNESVIGLMNEDFLSLFGVSLKDKDGNYKTADDILKEISEYLKSDEPQIVDFKEWSYKI